MARSHTARIAMRRAKAHDIGKNAQCCGVTGLLILVLGAHVRRRERARQRSGHPILVGMLVMTHL